MYFCSSLPPTLQVLLLAMKDMNVAKLTAVDLPLFNGITSDLFPGVEVPVLDYGMVRERGSKGGKGRGGRGWPVQSDASPSEY